MAAAGAWGQLGCHRGHRASPWELSRHCPAAQAVTLSCLFLSSFSRQQQSTCVITLGRRWTRSSSSRRPVGAAWSRWALARGFLGAPKQSSLARMLFRALKSFAVTVRGHPQPLCDCCAGIHSHWEKGSSQGWAAHAASSHCCCRNMAHSCSSHRNWLPAHVRRSWQGRAGFFPFTSCLSASSPEFIMLRLCFCIWLSVEAWPGSTPKAKLLQGF